MFPTNWPIYYAKLLSLGSDKSTVGIATLWTKKDLFAKKLDINSFACIGQLYSKVGINYMIRNMLAYPKIRYLILCGAELSGSGEEVVKLWETGESDFLDSQIPREAVNQLRTNIELIDLRGVNNIETIEEKLEEIDQNMDPFDDPKLYPDAVSSGPDQYPSDVSIFKVRGQKIASVWAKLMDTIMKFGERKFTDEYEIRECLNICAVIEDEDPLNHYIPNWLGFSTDEIRSYIDSFQDGRSDPNQYYTYGNRMREYFGIDQIEWIKKRLKSDPNAREAVASLIDPKNDLKLDGHRPCVTFVQAIKQRDKLNLSIFVRSHDMFAGWPQNAFGFLHLQEEICKDIGMERGVLTIISSSAHIYEYDWDKAKEIGEKYWQEKLPCETDPYGNFVVEIDKEKELIIVHHQSPAGLPIQTFEGKTSEELMIAITRAQAISIPQHAMDLGRQLYKAELALVHKTNFIQDQPLDLGLLPKTHEYFKGRH